MLYIFIFIFLTLIFFEQWLYRNFMPYPYRKGLLIYKTNKNVPDFPFWVRHFNKHSGSGKLFRLDLRGLNVSIDDYYNEVNFYCQNWIFSRSLLYMFAGQISYDDNGKGTLKIRMGYCSAAVVFFIFVAPIAGLFSFDLQQIGFGIACCLACYLYFYSFMSSYKRFISKN